MGGRVHFLSKVNGGWASTFFLAKVIGGWASTFFSKGEWVGGRVNLFSVSAKR